MAIVELSAVLWLRTPTREVIPALGMCPESPLEAAQAQWAEGPGGCGCSPRGLKGPRTSGQVCSPPSSPPPGVPAPTWPCSTHGGRGLTFVLLTGVSSVIKAAATKGPLDPREHGPGCRGHTGTVPGLGGTGRARPTQVTFLPPPHRTSHSLRSHAAPVRPGGQRQRPLAGSQGTPSLQSQCWRQPSPKEPGSHSAGVSGLSVPSCPAPGWRRRAGTAQSTHPSHRAGRGSRRGRGTGH